MKVNKVVGQAEVSNLVYEYGVRIDQERLVDVRTEMRLAHNLYNELAAEMRRIGEQARHWLETKAGDAARVVRNKIDVLNEAFREAKGRDDRDALKQIANERRSLWRMYYEVVGAARVQHRKELGALFLNKIGRRSDCPTYQIMRGFVADGMGWATGNAVLAASLQAWAKQWPKFKLPNFHAAHDIVQQSLEVQFTGGGLPVSKMHDGRHGDVCIIGTESGRSKYHSFRFRVGSGAAKRDITGTVYLHRPLPSDAVLQRARLVERRIGKDRKHYLQFVLLLKESRPQFMVPEQRSPLLALDFGWYFEEDGRRVAGVADSGDPGEAKIVRFPPSLEALFEKAEALASERSLLRDEIAGELLAVKFTQAPEAITDALVGLKRVPTVQGIAPGRIASLAIKWRDECPEYQSQWLARLEEWRKKDRLLWQAATHTAKRARNGRRKLYQLWALDWCRKYERIAIDTPDLEETAKVKDKTSGKHNNLGRAARAGRVRVALYELAQCIQWAAVRAGTVVAEVLGRTSTTCAHCGAPTVSLPDNSRLLACSNEECGAIEDREASSAAVVYSFVEANLAVIDMRYAEASNKKAEQLAKAKANQERRMAGRWVRAKDAETAESSGSLGVPRRGEQQEEARSSCKRAGEPGVPDGRGQVRAKAEETALATES